MRLQLVVVILALISSAFAQRSPAGGARAAAGPRQVAPLNPSAVLRGPMYAQGRIYARGPYFPYGGAYGGAYGAAYDADASFQDFYPADAGYESDGYVFDGFYAGLAPFRNQPQPTVPTPLVVINEDFQQPTIHPQLRDYSNVRLPEPGTVQFPPSTATAMRTQAAPEAADDQPIIFLIALQTHTIFPAMAYWVQGEALHFISLTGVHNQVSLALVDREFSIQLNRERRLPFTLPAAK